MKGSKKTMQRRKRWRYLKQERYTLDPLARLVCVENIQDPRTSLASSTSRIIFQWSMHSSIALDVAAACFASRASIAQIFRVSNVLPVHHSIEPDEQSPGQRHEQRGERKQSVNPSASRSSLSSTHTLSMSTHPILCGVFKISNIGYG